MAFLGLGRRSRPYLSGNPNEGAGAGGALVAAAASAERERLHREVGLTAAGFRVTHEDGDQLRRLIQPWQGRSFSYYDQIGEIWYASQFYARMMSLLRLYPAKLSSEGEWEETDDKDAVAALARIQDPGGGEGVREGLLSSYGRLMFIAGESYLLCSIDPDTKLEQWEMLSTDELRVQSGNYVRYRAPTMAAEELREIEDDDFEPLDPDTAVVYRLWKRHPRYSLMPDSPMKGVLDLCEELLILTRAVRARGRSRLAGSGILAISEEFSHPAVEATGDEDYEQDPFVRNLVQAMMAPIANEGAASQVVPLVIRGTTEAVQNGIRHIQLVDPMQLYPETGLRYECVKRIALGLDLPPEILLGMTDANHWTGWIVDDQTWKAHGQPASNQLVGDLTASYFGPELRSIGRRDWAQFSIQYDASAVVNHPDRGKDAKDLYDRIALSKASLRDATGFTEDDAPSEEERAERIGIAVRDSSLAWFGIPSPRSGGLEPEPGEIVTADGTTTSATDGAQEGAEVEPGPPDRKDAGEEPISTVVGGALEAAKVVGAADLAVGRCRELAGSRLRSLAKRDPDAEKMIDGISNQLVAARLGRDRVRALAGNEGQLIAGVRSVVEDTLAMWNFRDGQASVLLEQIERHAVRTLYDERPSPLPAQFSTYVSGVLARG